MIDENKLIEERIEWLDPSCIGREEYNKGWNDCNRSWLNIIAGQPKVCKWIPCSERLPDRNGTYLVTVCSYDETANINHMHVEHGNSDGSFLHYGTKKPRAKSGKYIVAWMPLPEPYYTKKFEEA